MTSSVGPSSEAPAQTLIDSGFALEVADAPFLHGPLTLADIAHVLDLLGRGIVPRESAARLLALLVETYETPAEQFPYDPAYGETYNCRERFFVERIGDEAGWLHAGRPRREAARVALRLVLRRQLTELITAAAQFSRSVADAAVANAETYMSDQTYLQQAQPSTFGHYVLTFAYSTLRESERLQHSLDWVNRSPGGAGCVNGSRLLRDRAVVARMLGFDGVIEHTRDAMWQVDGLIDLLASATSLLLEQSKLAEDLEIWNSREFGLVDLAGPYTRASVLMPQKRNPYSLAIVRGAAGVISGRLSGFLAVVKSPSARSDNLIYAQSEVPRALDYATRITRLMAEVVATLHVDGERMLELLNSGFSQATDLAEYVMLECDVDYRTAYYVVGRAVRTASERGLRGIEVTGEMLDRAAEELLGKGLGLGGRDLTDVLDPRAIVCTRDAEGGAAPATVGDMAARCRQAADGVQQAATARAAAFTAAETALLQQARETARG